MIVSLSISRTHTGMHVHAHTQYTCSINYKTIQTLWGKTLSLTHHRAHSAAALSLRQSVKSGGSKPPTT